MTWLLSSSSDPRALAVVDGTGPFAEFGPHYSRRTPGSKTFTGVGREIVLLPLLVRLRERRPDQVTRKPSAEVAEEHVPPDVTHAEERYVRGKLYLFAPDPR